MIPTGEQWNEIAALQRGDLANTSYAVVLSALARSGRTGVLRMARQPVQKQIHLVDGRPVECRSNLAHETFGRFLLSEGVLSEEQHESALTDSLARRVPLGEVLIERGLRSAHEIYRSLQKNLARKLLDCFTWERGEFELAEQQGQEDAAVKVNAAQLILTGVLKLTPKAEIDRGVDRFRVEPLGLDPYPTLGGSQLRLSGQARQIVGLFEAGPQTLDSLASTGSIPLEDVDRIVYAMALLGRVRPASEIDARRDTHQAEPEERIATSSPATQESGSDAVSDEQALLRRASIVEAYLSFNRKDSFELLELEEGATVPEIDKAFLKAAEIYAPWTLGAMGAGDFAEQGEILFLKAAQAYAELKNSETRGALIHRRKVLRAEEADSKKPKFSIKTDLLDSEEQFKKGLAMVERGELGKALELLEFAVDCDPQSAIYRAELAYRRDQFDSRHYRQQSIRDLKEAIRIDPKCGLGYYYLGLLLGDQDDVAEAEETLRKSIKLMAPDRRPIEALKELSQKKKR